MAFSTNHLPLLFFLFLVSSIQISARESKFFSKFARYSDNETNKSNINVEETKLPEKQVKQDEEPTFTTETHNGYGLYGRGSDQFPAATTTTTNEAHYTYSNLPEKSGTAEYTSESYEYKEPNRGSYYNNNYYNNKNNNNGYVTNQYSLSDSRFQENGNNNNNGYVPNQYSLSDTRFQENGNSNNNEYANKQYSLSDTRFQQNGNSNNNNWQQTKQGMSDTRFLENGRYSYNANNENYYPNEYQYMNGKSEGYGSSNSRGVDSRNQYNYGNNVNAYEQHNSVEEYQNLQEENQEGYVP